ncbi:MAG: L-galactose dehydrogenase [Harvfovirus sp.]|uniref:L-galactose dehydrogenase n=1 Tax=Harvfovirus sp. TaxID=2487768 RepID=A0A3G5A8F9_9VIRU|nr:MAG: L-galactose dehydrogenase [Harvfovirus sp.]
MTVALRCVGKIGLGCAGFGKIYGTRSVESLRKVVEVAMKNNIKYFDTAPYYGDSEKVLGRLLAPYARKSYKLSTKIGRFPSTKAHPDGLFDFSSKAVIDSVERSCRRLRTGYLDVVHCHDIEYADPKQLINETLPTLGELKKAGLIEYVGISGYPLAALRRILQSSKTRIDFVTSYSNYTLQNSLLGSFHWGKDVKLVNSGILGMGLLTRRGPEHWHPASKKLKDTAKKASEYCEKSEGIDIAEIATKYALHGNVADITLVEAYTAEQLEQILHWSHSEPDKRIVNNIQGIFNKANWKNKLWRPSDHHKIYS